jgi:MATE family multidrug resistance protein
MSPLGIFAGWALQALGNHGLWLAFLAFMLLRGICLGSIARRLQRRQQWFTQSHGTPAEATMRSNR